MTAIAVERFLIILLILITGVLALAEIAVVSARKVRLQQRGEEGDAGARAALELANAPNRFLAAHLGQIPGLAPYSNSSRGRRPECLPRPNKTYSGFRSNVRCQ